MDTENKPNLDKIEKSFLSIMGDLEESYGGIFRKGITDPKVIKKGDLEEFGKSLIRISEFLDNRLEDLEFQEEEEESKRIKPRLKKAINVVHEIGHEIEIMKTQEPNDYHWYVIGALTVVLIGLFNYIEMYIEYH